MKIAIIGAGIQGSCLALSLANQGIKSTLIDKSIPMQAASLRNEGKIHLGFVYALDNNGSTRELMLKGALHFAPLIEKWCGKINWQEFVSGEFNYAVMPDSLASIHQIEKSYSELQSMLNSYRDLDLHYMGKHLSYFWKKNIDLTSSPIINGQKISDFYKTEEVSVDPRLFSKFICERLLINNLITIKNNTFVKSIKQKSNFELSIIDNNRQSLIEADIVVNCAWEDREKLDNYIGITNDNTNYRVKHQILVKPKLDFQHLEPVTMVLGPYGDLVPWKDGLVYISWYPEGRTYFGSTPPQELENKALALEVAIKSLKVMEEMFPILKGSSIISSLPGVILAKGKADVDKKESALHTRNLIGVSDYKGWISIDTGKFTTAPFFAEEAKNLILEYV